MDDIRGRHADAAAVARVPGINVTGMVGIEVVSLRTQVAIHLNSHPYRVAFCSTRLVIVDQIVRFQHLQRKRNLAIAKGPPNDADKHLTRLSQAAN